ncbi:ester cyclase [Apilactobacillus xinyiensis]|nr:ester cyclase [Apilactobacillus xinyiensis]MCL0318581.1 ester cyclase [Apilactobacillus xinyiensis]
MCDIYRIEDDMIAEHWDIIEHNVENKQSNNSNGLF